MSKNLKNNNRQRKSKKNRTLKSESISGLLKQIRDLESFNKGTVYKDPVVFPSGQTFDAQVYNIVASFEIEGFHTSSTTVPVFGAIAFQISQVDDYTSYTAVFDQYRVKMVQYTFYPRQDVATNVNGSGGLFHTAIDYDDDNAVSTIGTMLDYANCIVTAGDKIQTRTFVPHVANAVYGNGAFTSYGNVISPWIDSASTNVKHFACKLATSIGPAVQTYDVVCRVWLQFKSQR
jgi:hypothetical protein